MENLIDTFQNHKKIKILILGSYRYLEILKALKQHLIKQGFENTFIADDIVGIPKEGTYDEKMDQILSEIQKLMQNSDFNLFVFFEDSNGSTRDPNESNRDPNGSTIVELTTFVQSGIFKEKEETTLVLLPRNFNISMLIGFLHQKRLNIFRYDFDFDIFEFTPRFIRINLYLK